MASALESLIRILTFKRDVDHVLGKGRPKAPEQPPPPPINTQHAHRIAGVIVLVAIALNALFIVLSNKYFADRVAIHGPVSAQEINAVRIAFGFCTGITAAAACAAVHWPRLVGHGLAIATSLACFVGAAAGYAANLHIVLPVTLLLVGLLLPMLVSKSLARSRAGWAFLVGMTAILAVVMLFGSTKVRNVLGIGLWYAMIVPGLLAVASSALAMIRTHYRD